MSDDRCYSNPAAALGLTMGSLLRGGATFNEYNVKIWTLNTGGLAGFWRLLNELKQMCIQKRPEFIMSQEVTCKNLQEWKATLETVDSLGYKAYSTEEVAAGNGKGVITLCKSSLPSRLIGARSDLFGRILGVAVHDLLLINTYCPPREEATHNHVGNLDEWLIGLNWQGRHLIGGDWNLQPNSWIIEALAKFRDFEIAPTATTSTTRWKGKRILDFFLRDMGSAVGSSQPLDICVSDHKIMELPFRFAKSDLNEYTFQKQMRFDKPAWLDTGAWQKCFDDSVAQCECNNWDEACFILDQHFGCAQQNTFEAQQMVDYSWDLAMIRLLCVFRHAFLLSLWMIPDDWEDFTEIARVTHLANHHLLSRISPPRRLQRTFPQDKAKKPICIRRLRHKLGRCYEIRNRIGRGLFDQITHKLVGKVPELEELDSDSVNFWIRTFEKQIVEFEKLDQQTNIQNWKRRMQCDIRARSQWVNRSKVSYYPSVQATCNHEVSTSKSQAASFLVEYWNHLHDELRQSDEQISANSEKLSCHIRRRIDGVSFKDDRPLTSDFRASLLKTGGAPGTDQWQPQDLKLIAKNPLMCSMIWNSMSLWEQSMTSPSVVQNVRVAFVPKANKVKNGVIDAGGLRPISVFSVFWRCWSGCWVQSETIKTFSRCFSDTINIGRHGTETQAATLDALICSWKHGATLDFSHCFDTVNISMIQDALKKSLPASLLPWAVCTTEHWKTSSRWFTYHKHVHQTPVVCDVGIPQGDAAAPLFLGVLLSLGHQEVVSALDSLFPNEQFYELVYMDDRSFATTSRDALECAVQTWKIFADQFGLIENGDKRQTCDLSDPSEPQFIEVLGCLLGNPSIKQLHAHHKGIARIESATRTAIRIGRLPLSLSERIGNFGLFLQGKVAYGWIGGLPKQNLITSFNNQLWRSAGRFRSCLKLMRTVLVGGHVEFHCAWLLRSIRICFRANKILDCFPNVTHFTLKRLVYQHLEELGWFLSDSIWRHSELPYQFGYQDIHCDLSWKKTAHALRQSFRLTEYQKLASSSRREIVFGGQLPVFEENRLDLARKWIQTSASAFCIGIGAVKSAYVKSLGMKQFKFSCPRCGEVNPKWDHVWSCYMEMWPPNDLLLRRFGLPRTHHDIALCTRFLEGVAVTHPSIH